MGQFLAQGRGGRGKWEAKRSEYTDVSYLPLSEMGQMTMLRLN